MRLRVWTALVATCWGTGCSGESRRELPEKTPDASLPTTCRALQGLPSTVLVDDFEDGDELLHPAEGLRGLWYVENDGTGEQEPPAGPRAPGSLVVAPGAPSSDRHALHTRARGFQSWGAFVGVRLNAARAGACTVDVSASQGLSFVARGTGDLRVNLGAPGTTPVTDGGECAAEACSDFGAVVTLGKDFRSYEVRFDELVQPDWAEPSAWEPERVVRVSFWAEQRDLDLWLDDVRFF